MRLQQTALALMEIVMCVTHDYFHWCIHIALEFLVGIWVRCVCSHFLPATLHLFQTQARLAK